VVLSSLLCRRELDGRYFLLSSDWVRSSSFEPFKEEDSEWRVVWCFDDWDRLSFLRPFVTRLDELLWRECWREVEARWRADGLLVWCSEEELTACWGIRLDMLLCEVSWFAGSSMSNTWQMYDPRPFSVPAKERACACITCPVSRGLCDLCELRVALFGTHQRTCKKCTR
jgi:hypothetical protein